MPIVSHTRDDAETDRPTLICEDLLLLLTRSNGSAVASRRTVQIGMATAVVADAIAAGRVTLTSDRKPRLVVVDAALTGVAAIDRAMPRLVSKNGQQLSKVVSDPKVDPTPEVLKRLTERGLIMRTDQRFGGLLPARYPTLDSTIEDLLRARLRAGILGWPVGFHDATLLAIVEGLGAGQAVFPQIRAEIGRGALSQRLKAITAPIPVTRSVREAHQLDDSASAGLVLLCMVPIFLGLVT